ncbi:MAG: ATP synthase F1 subunit epsilon [Bacilli bacterium]|jgi:F-type H+-transporting ATPase subunit epsilon|nr:ATP synthase F1 subunit epsilon [Bacilli bacterium]
MSDKFPFEIKSPDGKKFDGEAEIINMNLIDGMIGIMAHHLPLVGVIDICHLDYKVGNQVHYFAIGGGILNVQKDRVLILADSFEAKENIDKTRAEEAKARAEALLEKAKTDPDSNIDIKRAELSLKRAINRLSLSEIK